MYHLTVRKWRSGSLEDPFATIEQARDRIRELKGDGLDTDRHPRDRNVDFDWNTLHIPEGAVRACNNIEDVQLIIIPSFPWWMNILPLESVDEKKRIARSAIPATSPMCQMVSYAKDEEEFKTTAWIENVPEGLNAPGTWMMKTQTRKVYLWPDGGQPGNNIHAPILRELIRVEGHNDEWGDADVPVRGLRFVGLQLTGTDRGVWDENDAGIQHDWEMLDKDNAMLRFRGAEGNA